jgi:hypothetical protein
MLPRAQFGEHGLHVLDRAAHPFQFGVLELLPDECRAHLVVAKDGAVVALGGFVQFDLVVLDGGGLELLGDALLHVARCLPNLEKTLVRLVVNRIGVDARPSLRLRREDLLDGGLTHRHRRRGHRADKLLDERDFTRGQPVFRVSPYPSTASSTLCWHEGVDLARGVLGWLVQED